MVGRPAEAGAGAGVGAGVVPAALASCTAWAMYHHVRPSGARTLNGAALPSSTTTTPTWPGCKGPVDVRIGPHTTENTGGNAYGHPVKVTQRDQALGLFDCTVYMSDTCCHTGHHAESIQGHDVGGGELPCQPCNRAKEKRRMFKKKLPCVAQTGQTVHTRTPTNSYPTAPKP